MTRSYPIGNILSFVSQNFDHYKFSRVKIRLNVSNHDKDNGIHDPWILADLHKSCGMCHNDSDFFVEIKPILTLLKRARTKWRHLNFKAML